MTRPGTLACGALLALAALAAADAHAETCEFYILTLRHQGVGGSGGDAAGAFPAKPLEETPGLRVTRPGDDGSWTVETWRFSPAEVTVLEGDEVRLHFVGVDGAAHRVTVTGIADVQVKQGSMQTVSFTAVQPGIITFVCQDHPPSMGGQVVVLPTR